MVSLYGYSCVCTYYSALLKTTGTKCRSMEVEIIYCYLESAPKFSVNIEVLMAVKIHSLRRCMILQGQGCLLKDA